VTFNEIQSYVIGLFTPLAPNWGELKLVVSLLSALILALLFNRLMERVTPGLARRLTDRMESSTANERFIRTRRMETFLSLGVSIGRVLVVFGALVIAWKLTNSATGPIAVIGASTIFIILGSATIVPLLRDITYGFIMIFEHWYNVGDHIVIEPFPQLGGIVEQVTLRSTKLRSMNGEVIWVHNQHIQAVRVTTSASLTVAIETFVSDPAIGRQVIEKAFKVMPVSPITLPQPLAITEIKEVDDGLWRITAICEVTPYREWIVENFAVDAIKTTDVRVNEKPVIIHGPIAYYADVTAEKRFRRSVRSRMVRTPAPEPTQSTKRG
jgi:small conductance mechanosensitive channel